MERFLSWQAAIVREYLREDQFITHNFNFDWKGYTSGMNPCVNHYMAGKAVDIAGADIYHPTQDELTGLEISFGGDSTRSIKNSNYFVLETQAQGYPCWLPYDGQLRLQAYSHVACGANMVEYWHWSSIHNSFETYWKGVLSHDLKENDVYRAAKVIGQEFGRIGDHLVNMKKKNRVAILHSNETLTALNWFPVDGVSGDGGKISYNDILYWMYRQLYQLNVECDFLWPESENLDGYDLIIIPALYAAPEELLYRLDAYVKNGGHLFATFKTAFADENVKVYHDCHPHILNRCLGVSYSDFTFPKNVRLKSGVIDVGGLQAQTFMELLNADTAEAVAMYDHINWKRYAAMTRNVYGKGTAFYLGCHTEDELLKKILVYVLKDCGLWTQDQENSFPIVIKRGVNDYGKEVVYYMNFSWEKKQVNYRGKTARELLGGKTVETGTMLDIGPWDLAVLEIQTDSLSSQYTGSSESGFANGAE